MKIKLFILTFLLTLGTMKLFAETNSEYIQKFDEKITVRPYIGINSYGFNLHSTDDSSVELKYRPNIPINAGLKLTYTDFSLSLSTKALEARNEDTYGETKFTHITSTYYGKNFGYDLYFLRYEGYYLDNSSEIVSDGEYIKQSDLEVMGLGGNFFYKLMGENFSFGAAFEQNKKQLKSAGAIFAMATVNHTSFESARPIIPPEQRSYYGEAGSFIEAKFTSLFLGVGAAYSFIFGDFYFTPAAFISPGFQLQKFTTSTKYVSYEKTITASVFSFKMNIRAALGYNSESFFAGINFYSDITNIPSVSQELVMSTQLVETSIFAGYRF